MNNEYGLWIMDTHSISKRVLSTYVGTYEKNLYYLNADLTFFKFLAKRYLIFLSFDRLILI